jgi:hypothetical protein
MRFFFILIVVSGLMSSAIGQTSSGIGAGNGKPPAKKQLPYTIIPATGWEKMDTLVGTSLITVMISPADSTDDNFRENMNIIYEEVGEMGMDEYYKLSEESLKNLPDIKKLGLSDTVMNGMNFKILHYTFAADYFDAEVMVYITIVKGKAYVITCSCLQGQMDNWQKTYEKMVATFIVD